MNELMKRLADNAVSRFRFAGKSRSAAQSDFDKYAILIRRPWSEDILPRQTLQYRESKVARACRRRNITRSSVA
jgi:hypothetical protein